MIVVMKLMVTTITAMMIATTMVLTVMKAMIMIDLLVCASIGLIQVLSPWLQTGCQSLMSTNAT